MIELSALLIGFVLPNIIAQNAPIVQIPLGHVEGSLGTSRMGKTFTQFYGIPYAKPPVNELRLEEPQKPDPWTGIWKANFSTICLQVMHEDVPDGGRTMGTEDCLYLNVFVPSETISKNAKLDVIVDIHGGGYMFASSNTYAGPHFLMDRNVILVTFNYRLGIFGFLSTLDKELPGNLGMKDQVMALQWVKDNIEHFGGNPNSITISGLSCGGASVNYHMLSPLSKGLFHKAISVSGSALNPWTFDYDPITKANKVGAFVGCSYPQNSAELKKCLKRRNGEQLVEATRLLRRWTYNPFAAMGLVVDNYAKNPFLPEMAYKLIREGKINDVPWITSVTTAEGLYPVAQFAMRDVYFDELRDNWADYIAATLHYEDTLPKDLIPAVGIKIKEYYMGDREVSKQTFPEIIQIASDRNFVDTIEEAAREMAKVMKSPIYFYQYNYTADNIPSLANFLCHYPEKYGVSHGDDVFMVFDIQYRGPVSDRDLRMSNTVLDIWSTFSKSGSMRGLFKDAWLPVQKDDQEIKYLYIGSPDDIEMRSAKELGHREFWQNIPFAENDKLIANGKLLRNEL